MSDNYSDDLTRRHQPADSPLDPQPTIRHSPVRPDSLELTRPAERILIPGEERPRTPAIPRERPPERRLPDRPPQARPARRERPRRRRRGRTLWQLLLAGVAFVLAFSLVFALIYVLAPPPRTNILVMGVDARPEEGMVTRTDTLILATVDPDQPYVGMLSIPRDLYIDIPGYGPQRINAAHIFAESDAVGTGPAKVKETIEATFGVPVHRTLRINFDGFVAIVDAAGGVTVDVERAFVDYDYPTVDYGTQVISFEEGTQHLDGERALQYARSRHASTDFDRSARQQQVIGGLVRRMANPANWWRWPAVIVAVQQNVETDLTIIDMVALAPAVLWTGPGNFDGRVFDPTMASGRTTSAGASVLEPNWSGIEPVLDEMFRR